MYDVKIGDYFIYLGDTNSNIGYTYNKKYIITHVDKFNCYFEDDNGGGIVSHLKHTYTDKEWLFVSKKEIRKQKISKLKEI
jgi:hypothetical protein